MMYVKMHGESGCPYEGRDGVYVVMPKKDLAGSEEIGLFRSRIEEIVAASAKEGMIPRIVVDLSSVSSINSTGMGELVTRKVKVKEQGGLFAIAEPNDRIAKVLKITMLGAVFHPYECLENAIADLRKAKP